MILDPDTAHDDYRDDHPEEFPPWYNPDVARASDLPVMYGQQKLALDGELTVEAVLAMFASAGVRCRCDIQGELQLEPVVSGV